MAQWNCIPATPSMSAASCWWSGAHLTALPRPESTALIVKRAADAQRLAAADALDQPPGPCTASDSWQIEDPLDAENRVSLVTRTLSANMRIERKSQTAGGSFVALKNPF